MTQISDDGPNALDATALVDPEPRRWRIEVVRGRDAGRHMVQRGGSVIVGTRAGVDLLLSDPTVSARHVELRLLRDGVVVIDLESTNGTRAFGRAITHTWVPAGSLLTLGSTELRLAFAEEDTSPEVRRFGDFVTRAPAMCRVIAQLETVAETHAKVLLEGESGSGKELLARAIHARSPRHAGPFVVVDCGAVQKDLFEAHLFGHVRGAFTDANCTRPGAFEAAHGGTLFLDELGELPMAMQARLLRVIERGSVRRVGEVEEHAVDVRIIAATNRDLESLVRARVFREDLFYRVAVVRVHVPPLRERPEDIALLTEHLTEKLTGTRVELSPEALAALALFDWPGNVRELRNVLEQAINAAGGGPLTPELLFPGASRDANAMDFHRAKDRVIADFERRFLGGLLTQSQGNLTRAARAAGLSRTALYKLLKRTGHPTAAS